MNRRTARRGLTLLEVVLALAILGGAIAVISQVSWSGLENARQTRELVQAELLAENVMAELVVGCRPLESLQDSPLADDDAPEDGDRWILAIDVAPAEMEGLLRACVTVRENTRHRREVKYSLVRWLPDPMREGAQAAESGTVELP